MIDVKTSKANSRLSNKRENRVPAIIEINKVRKRLLCELNAYSRRDVLKFVTRFNPSIESMDIQNFDWRRDL